MKKIEDAKMKISKHDKYMALIHHSEYRKDFNKWGRLVERVKKHNKKTIDDDLVTLKAWEKEISKKWKVRYPFPPPIGVKNYDGYNGIRLTTFFTGAEAVDVINPSAASKQTLLNMVYEGYNPVMFNCQPSNEKGKYVSTHKSGKHLCMIVDINKTETELLRDFKGWIKYYKKMLPKSKTKESTLNIWNIFKLKSCGLKLSEIAEKTYKGSTAPRVIEGRDGQLKEISPYRAHYKQTERAYNKALAIIKQAKSHL